MPKAHALLDQGVGADRNLDLAPFQETIDLLFPFGTDLSGQQRHGQAELLGQRRQRPVVLLGQEFRRSHEGHLVAAIEGGQGRKEGHDRLARANIPLDQAVHRVGRGHIQKNGLNHPLLGRGQLKRQDAVYLPDERPRHNGQPLFPDGAAPAQRHAQLQIKEFVEHHGPMRLRGGLVEFNNLGIQRGNVQLPQGVIERHQVQALTDFLRHAVGDLIDIALNRPMHDPSHGSHRHFGGLIVNGQDAGGLVVFFQRLHVRVDHPLATLHALLDLAEQQDALAELIALLKIAMLMIPQQKEKTGFVSNNGFQDPAPAADQKAPFHAGDLAADRRLIPHLKMTNLA